MCPGLVVSVWYYSGPLILRRLGNASPTLVLCLRTRPNHFLLLGPSFCSPTSDSAGKTDQLWAICLSSMLMLCRTFGMLWSYQKTRIVLRCRLLFHVCLVEVLLDWAQIWRKNFKGLFRTYCLGNSECWSCMQMCLQLYFDLPRLWASRLDLPKKRWRRLSAKPGLSTLSNNYSKVLGSLYKLSMATMMALLRFWSPCNI